MISPVKQITVLLLILSVLSHVRGEKCVFVDFFRSTSYAQKSPINCQTHQICKERAFNISYIHYPSYYFDKMEFFNAKKPIEFILRLCCGKCVKYSTVQVFRNISELTPLKMETSDFIYPLLAEARTKILYGYRYIPFINVPPVMLVTAKQGVDIINFILQVFPVTLICILASILSGFVCWGLETRKNGDEFPRSFLIGWYDGFWWSFISMTTVGYGDKSPKTFWGRIFSVVWISLGMICYGLLTGIVYSEVMKINSPPPPNMKGKTIGSLLYRDYDALVVAQNGGKLFPQNIPSLQPVDAYEDALVMINNLRQQRLDGFVLDQYTYWHLQAMANKIMTVNSKLSLITTEDAMKSISFLLTQTTSKTIKYQGTEQLTYGILVRHKHHYDYFVDMVKNSRKRAQGRIEASWNYYEAEARFSTIGNVTVSTNMTAGEIYLYEEDSNTLFSYDGIWFRTAVIVIGCLLLGIGVIGVLVELKRSQGNIRYLFARQKIDQSKDLM